MAEQVVLFVGKACGRVFRTVEGRAVDHPGQRADQAAGVGLHRVVVGHGIVFAHDHRRVVARALGHKWVNALDGVADGAVLR